MDFQQFRTIVHGTMYRRQLSNGAIDRITSSKSYKTMSKVPQAILDYGMGIYNMFPGTAYLIERLKEARKPKFHRCKSIEEIHVSHREIGIINGYRNENCSFHQAVESLFKANNETVNFWTHFLPTMYFLWIFYNLAVTLPLFTNPYLSPLTYFMIASCTYPLVSCLAHAFSCLSITSLNLGFFMDYATLSLYGWGVAVAYYNYALPPSFVNSFYGSIYIPVAGALALLSTIMACSSRFDYKHVSQQSLRLGSFVIPYLWDSLPLLYRIFYCDYYNDACVRSSAFHLTQFVCVFFAAFFYGSHIPERFAPGSFDFVGNSHNLLHVFGITATYHQIRGIIIDMEGQRATMNSPDQAMMAQEWITIATPTLLIVNLLLVAYHTRKVNYEEIEKIRNKRIQ